MNKKVLQVLIVQLLSLLTFIACIRLSSLQNYFSSDISLRLQTESLLDGHFYLSKSANLMQRDWALSDYGWQQVWGLGVPLLRLPFDFLAQLFGYVGLPDRILFLLLIVLSATALYLAISLYIGKQKIYSEIALILLVPLLISAPAFIHLFNVRFAVYEEVVAINYLWSWIVLAFALVSWKKNELAWFLLLAIFAGFHPWIRPTGGVFSVIVLLVTAFSIYPVLKNKVIYGLLLSGSLVLLLLFTNNERFGAFFEFGHKINFSGLSHNEFALRFGYPFMYVALPDAMRELFALMFISEPVPWNRALSIVTDWQAPVLRLREIYFKAYDLTDFALIILTALTGLFFLSKNNDRLVRNILIISIATNLALFIFYLYSPAICARYFVDFLASIQLSWLIIYLLSEEKQYLVLLAPILIFALQGSRSILAEPYENIEYKFRNALTETQLQKKLTDFKNKKPLQVPAQYNCEANTNNLGITRNLTGWNYNTSCSVSNSSLFVIKSSQCISIKIEVGADSFVILRDKIRVKSNLDTLNYMGSSRDGNHHLLSYCLVHKPKDVGFRQIAIGWSRDRELGQKMPQHKLISIQAYDLETQAILKR